MSRRLTQGGHRSRYRLRKQTVEPVFGQIKAARGFRQFHLRGLAQVAEEWRLICTAHNLLSWRKRRNESPKRAVSSTGEPSRPQPPPCRASQRTAKQGPRARAVLIRRTPYRTRRCLTPRRPVRRRQEARRMRYPDGLLEPWRAGPVHQVVAPPVPAPL